jgi:hypothetical protein
VGDTSPIVSISKPSAALKEINNQAGSTLFVRPGSFGFAA